MYRKRTILFVFISILWPLIASSQDSLTKQLSPFTSIHISHTGKVILTQGSDHTWRVDPSDDSEDVKVTVKGKTLSVDAPSAVKVYVTMKEIEELSIGGWGSITSGSPLKSENLQLNISGSGRIELKDADVKNLSANINGLGKITLSGKAESVDMNIPGSGKIDAAGLKTTNCNASIPGVGKCTVDVTDNLNVTIGGSGSVNYVNPPKNLSKSISGIGKVRGSGSDTTSVRFGNKKIVISDDNEQDDNNDDEDTDDNDHDYDRAHKWEKWGDKWGEDWKDKWENKWEDKFPFSEIRKSNSGKNKPSWPGIELGVNGYMDADGSTTLPPGLDYLELDYGKSISFSINFFDARKKFFSRHLFLFTGLGITWNNYRFNNNITLSPTSSTVLATVDTISYTKNKLATSYLVAPAMVEVFFGNRRYRSFHISGGMMLGYKLGSHTKQKYESDGKTVKTKVRDDFNLNPFRASVRVSAGYGRINIFAEQALTTFFKKDKGPILYPFTAGIGISSF